jgi:nicotinamidase-related amidase
MRDALLVIDVLDDFAHRDGPALLESFRERHESMRQAIANAREAKSPIIYVNDDKGRWDSNAPELIREVCERGSGGDVVGRLVPEPGDYVLLKHRYSAFDHTALDILVKQLLTDRLIIVGATTEGCVVQTAIDARERGLKVTILASACATVDTALEAIALRYAERVGGVRVEDAG